MPFDGVFIGQEHGVVPPCDPLFSDEFRKGDERFHALPDIGYARLDIPAVGGDGVVEIGAVFVGYLVQAGQDGRVILGAEQHRVDLVGRKLVARHLVREERVAGVDEPLRKPL